MLLGEASRVNSEAVQPSSWGKKPPARSFKACQDLQVRVRVRGEGPDFP